MEPPTNLKQLRGFLGHVGYYRRFVQHYANLAAPLTQLLKKDVKFEWTQERQNAFEELKLRLIIAPIMTQPKWGEPWHVFTNASGFCIGLVLSQKDEYGKDHPVYYASRQLNHAERNYTTTEREALGLVYACRKFRHYLLGYKTYFYTDHNALKYLVNQTDLSGRIARWMLLLMEFDFEIIVKPGRMHDNADYLSRLKGKGSVENIPDDFPDEQLFHIEGEGSLYYDIVRYLVNGIFPEGMNTEQKAIFVHKVGPYTLRKGVLYKLGADERLRRCLEVTEIRKVIQALHDGEPGGHYALANTVRKISDTGYWWPTMYKDIKE